MRRSTSTLLITVLLCLQPGCSDEPARAEDPSPRRDAGFTDDTAALDTSPGQDASEDTQPDPLDPSDAEPADTSVPDTAEPDAAEPDAAEPDAAEPDASEPDDFEGRPQGQCVESADCPQTALGPGMCSRALPGGACLGCGTDGHCPGDTVCQFGTCVTECDGDGDCPPGLGCTGRGACGALRCQGDACPVPLFGCSDSGLCQRSSCETDAQCPAQTTCQGGRCIEDRAL